MNTFPRSILVLVAVILVVPVASAAHWTTYSVGLDGDFARTTEDDARVVNEPANRFHGWANRVVAAGRVVGDGSLFLDARIGNAAVLGDLPVVYASLTAGVTGRDDIVFPGYAQLSAWYGTWRDLDGDRRIADSLDSCACPLDEFKWRGRATEESIAMHGFILPGTHYMGFAAAADRSRSAGRPLEDRTSLDREEQSWVTAGSPPSYGDASILSPLTTLVIADPPAAVGTDDGVDFTHPRVLIDVDRYESLSADLEALWAPLAREIEAAQDPEPAAWAAVAGFLPLANDVINATGPAFAIVSAISAEHVAPVTAAAVAQVVALQQASGDPSALTRARFPREPNTLEDDSEGRALFGGVGDYAGSFNGYAGYADGHHLWIENRPLTLLCPGVYAEAPETGLSFGMYAFCTHFEEDYGPSAADGKRSTGSWLGFWSIVTVWRDGNRDGYPGEVCDPASEEFDAERSVCTNWGGESESGETLGVCDVSSARAGALTLTPMGGPWPGVVVVRNQREATRLAYTRDPEILTDDKPVTLMWREHCEGGFMIESRDALFFPKGASDVPIRVETEITIPGYVDVELGIDVGFERARDVDVIPGVL